MPPISARRLGILGGTSVFSLPPMRGERSQTTSRADRGRGLPSAPMSRHPQYTPEIPPPMIATSYSCVRPRGVANAPIACEGTRAAPIPIPIFRSNARRVMFFAAILILFFCSERNEALYGTSEFRDEHIALISTHHQPTSEWIRFR